jgi:outer membrane receptor protein involved in Fe transport
VLNFSRYDSPFPKVRKAGVLTFVSVVLSTTGISSAEELNPVVVVGSRESPITNALGSLPQLGAASVSAISPNQTGQQQATRLEDLAKDVPGMAPRTLDAGLSSAVNLRGFLTSRHYVNGLPDTQRMFTRDFSTVQEVQVLRGAAGIVTGSNSPGGSVWFLSKLPLSAARYEAALTVGSDQWRRVAFDLNTPVLDNLAVRLVGAYQDGDTNPGGLSRNSKALLGSARWRYSGDGSVTIEQERTNNHSPFTFGTVIVNGRPMLDRIYAASEQAAQRIADRQAIHWVHAFSLNQNNTIKARADYQSAQGKRDETLFGFFTITNANTLSGYYTKYKDDFRQTAAKLEVAHEYSSKTFVLASRLGYEELAQDTFFTGVQNIGGFSLSVQNPDFSGVNISKLSLTNRYINTDLNESGTYFLQTLEDPALYSVSWGLRNTQFNSRSLSASGVSTSTSNGGGTVARVSASLFPKGHWTPYASYSEGLQPNSGLTRGGGFLPAQSSKATELGVKTNTEWGSANASLFEVEQTNLPARDPTDRNFVVGTGVKRVQGIEAIVAAQITSQWRAIAWVNAMHTKNLTLTSATQGQQFVSVPGRTASIKIEHTYAWVQWQGISNSWANPQNTVRLNGYGLAHLGARYKFKPFEVAASITNAFNKSYVQSATDLDDVYQGPRRQIWLTARMVY